MSEGQNRPYSERVKNLADRVFYPDYAKMPKAVAVDEYHGAMGATAQYGGNILGVLKNDLSEGRKPLLGLRKAKGDFLRGLGKIDTSQLPPEKAQEFSTIMELAKKGKWNDLGFISQLNAYCFRFSYGQSIYQEEDKE